MGSKNSFDMLEFINIADDHRNPTLLFSEDSTESENSEYEYQVGQLLATANSPSESFSFSTSVL